MESQPQKTASKFKRNFFSLSIWSLISLFIMVFIMGLLKIYSPDLGFHLKSAEWMLENKKFIYIDSFAHGSVGNKYFDLQWLYQLFTYKLYTAGENILIIVNALLITISLILIWYRFLKNSQINIRSIQLGFFTFIALTLVQPLTFEVRPHVLSWIYLNFVLYFLESYKRGNKKLFYLLPLIMVIWVNSHSLAILGLVTIGIYNIGIFFEKKKIDIKLLLISAISFLAFLINPYFLDGLIYPFIQFDLISGNSQVKAYFAELQSPFDASQIKMLGFKYFTDPLFLIHLSGVLSIFCIFRATIKKRFTDALLLIAYLIILYLSIKNYGYFLVASLPLIVKYILEWLELRKKKTPPNQTETLSNKNKTNQTQLTSSINPFYPKIYTRVAYLSIILAILISITSITDGYSIFRHSPYRFGFSVDKDQLPVEAVTFLNKNGIKGKLLNHLDFGGYLMANYKEKVFIDGRMDVLPEDFFNKYYESITTKNGFKKLLDEYDPEIVVFPYAKAIAWWDYFLTNKKQSGYKPIYFDGLSVIYVKSDKYPILEKLLEKNITEVSTSTAVNDLQNKISIKKPQRLMVLINGLCQKQSFSIADQNKAIYCFTNGFDTAALYYSSMGIEKSTIGTPNIFKNLSLYYQDKKMYNEAELCEKKSE